MKTDQGSTNPTYSKLKAGILAGPGSVLVKA
jgi:hypothetical protein